MDLKNLPFWGQVVLVGALCVALTCVAYWAFPNFSEMQKRNANDAKHLEGLETHADDMATQATAATA